MYRRILSHPTSRNPPILHVMVLASPGRVEAQFKSWESKCRGGGGGGVRYIYQRWKNKNEQGSGSWFAEAGTPEGEKTDKTDESERTEAVRLVEHNFPRCQSLFGSLGYHHTRWTRNQNTTIAYYILIQDSSTPEQPRTTSPPQHTSRAKEKGKPDVIHISLWCLRTTTDAFSFCIPKELLPQ
ncbi:hypothetical protein BDQ17DRAFT_1333174 [Cyathus striatus]|nr:hypothetical protein BDQ17DRAFT_1333174 [Cyathus striatus]